MSRKLIIYFKQMFRFKSPENVNRTLALNKLMKTSVPQKCCECVVLVTFFEILHSGVKTFRNKSFFQLGFGRKGVKQQTR